ncbi:MAG: glycosyltransferase family 2 protein [Planctomycetota bacterium]|jgi:dolichol-phosphate mannosyltransferase
MDYRLITVVVPLYDEADTLVTLADEIRETARANGLNLQVVFVDDGSRDDSWSKVVALAEDDPSIGGVRFKRNYGKAAALMAGFAVAEGEFVFTMDADLQDPPQEMPRFIEAMDEGYDVVSGWKRVRYDPWHKVYPSRIFNKMIGWLTGVHLHDHVCGFKCFRRQVAKEISIYGEFHRFTCVLAGALGYRVTEIATLHRPRRHGKGKYGISRFAKGFIDLITIWFLTRYDLRPQHVLGIAGLVTLLLGTVLWLLDLTGLLIVLAAGMGLMALSLVSALIAARKPEGVLYRIIERTGWCARAQMDELAYEAPLQPSS